MRVKCLAQEHSTMSPARARTRTARSGVERTNHEATVPPTVVQLAECKCSGTPRSLEYLWFIKCISFVSIAIIGATYRLEDIRSKSIFPKMRAQKEINEIFERV